MSVDEPFKVFKVVYCVWVKQTELLKIVCLLNARILCSVVIVYDPLLYPLESRICSFSFMMTLVKEDASNLSLHVGRDELLYYIDALLR